MSKKRFKLLLISSLAVLTPFSALAAPCPNDTEWAKCVINNVVNLAAWPIFVVVVFVAFILTGLYFLLAKGDPSKIDIAKKAVTWGVVGIAFGIISFVAVATGKWLFS